MVKIIVNGYDYINEIFNISAISGIEARIVHTDEIQMMHIDDATMIMFKMNKDYTITEGIYIGTLQIAQIIQKFRDDLIQELIKMPPGPIT